MMKKGLISNVILRSAYVPKTYNLKECYNFVDLQNPAIKLQWKVVVYAVRNLDHTADSYSDACEGERLMFWRKKRR